MIERPDAIRHGVVVAKQCKVLVKREKKEKYFDSMKHLERFVNRRVIDNEPRERRNKRIEWSITMRYVLERGVELNMNTPFSNEKFKLMQLNAIRIQGTDSESDYFNWSPMRDTMALHRSFYISYRYVSNRVGGEGDCLIDCIKSTIALSDEEIARYREIVPENVMADVSDFGLIELKLNMNLVAPGVYESKMCSPIERTVYITAFENHAEVISKTRGELTPEPPVDFENRRIVLMYYPRQDTSETLRVVGQMTKEGFMKETIDDDDYEKYRWWHRSKRIWLIDVNQEPTEELWKQYDDFERFLRSKFNTSFTRYESLANFAVALFRSTLTRTLETTSQRDDLLLDCIMHSGGALVDFKPGNYANVKYFDYNSFYPSLLLGNVPIVCPVWGDFSCNYMKECSQEEKDKYGLDRFMQLPLQGWYHVIIDDCEFERETPRRFMKSKSGYYYSDEIKEMQKHRYNFKLGANRAIVFDKATERAPVFKTFYELLYTYKMESNNKVCKMVMNSLLGKLASKTYKSRRVFDRPIKLKDNEQIEGAKERVFITKDYDVSKYAYMPWIQAVVYARARMRLNELIDNVGRQNVVCVATDGIICEGTCTVERGDNIGEIKLDKYGDVQIEPNGRKKWTKNMFDDKTNME